ncbi:MULTISPECIES: ABC transporter substrate-binding protein [Streptomyces]|uniref:ABC transporter substrate-binding protein n=1 Tax=Streptomyces TaxID=1883 RepID=UPI00081B0B75|nr:MULTISPECIES: ABC transporter substrate-binding protein [unclassified Streptomyces]MYQ50009.1 ABC transporter substrate-binding protein [Streptomyces sp. SID4941]SCD31683.1 NitT/TauT family transport system substrate-binding protein [Streptomyces sp. PalvLS-984]SDC88718.1 NitT/TauT family transport system substrate-binding protein [Streptomyces sp. AmelKG-A3]
MKQALRAGVGALTVSALAALTACGGGASSESSSAGSGKGTATVQLAIASAVIGPKEEVATYAVAKEEGFLAEEKLDVKTINTDGSVAAVQAVASGSADISPADASAILAAREKGVPVVAVGGLVQNWPWRIATLPGKGIKSAADLKGKKIGVISLASGSAPYARAFAEDAGLDPQKDVDLLPVGVGSQALSALESGKVDALALYTQAYTTLELTGKKFDYLENGERFDGIRSLTFAVHEDTLRSKKDEITRFLRASYKGLLFSAVNPEAAMRDGYKVFPAILSGQKAGTRIENDTAILESWVKTAVPAEGEPESFTDWGVVSDEAWTRTADYMKSSGTITKDPDLAALWDDSLLKDAGVFDTAAVISKAESATK